LQLARYKKNGLVKHYAHEEQSKSMIDLLVKTTEVLSLKEIEKKEVEEIKEI
jgi:hypothetical protein